MSRRLVVVLFLDLVGSTRLAEREDPERLQQLLEQYYDLCSTAVEDAGGIVEKFIGDAVMAVFGATRSREDDAPRALLAATQIRAGAARLAAPRGAQLEVHCGVAAGEALVTRSSRAGLRVVGAVVNLASRLQSAAAAGDIVVSDTVAELVRSDFALESVPPLTLKGASGPVLAYRLIGPMPTHGRDDVQLVDRRDERDRLRAAYGRVSRDRRGRAVLVLGPPGIGKTRLVRETVDGLTAVTVAWADCPPYGGDTTSRTLVQVLDAVVRQPGPAAELARTDTHIAAVLTDLHRAARAQQNGAAPGPGFESVSWAVRALLTAAAAGGPVVVVWDGLDLADRSLLLLVGDLVRGLADLPVLTVGVGRSEVADDGLPWLGTIGGHDRLDVRALPPVDCGVLAAALAAAAGAEVQPHGTGAVERAVAYSGGNPLFIRLMLDAVLAGRPTDVVPPTITALIGGMIDRLPDGARALLGAAAVVGSPFTREQLSLLGEPAAEDDLDVLVARQVLQADGDGYSFAQQPVHEVAYGRLDKQRRLVWHRQLAEQDVSPAFHFDAAARLLGELRPEDAQLPELARRAAVALIDEGTATLRQRDVPAAVGLLARAWAVAPDGPQRAVAALRLSDALLLAGDGAGADGVVAALLDDTVDTRARRVGLVQTHLLDVRLGRAAQDVDDLHADLDGDPGDRLAWCRFEQLRMQLFLRQNRYGDAERAVRAALGHALAAGDAYEEYWLLATHCEVGRWSPTPIAEQLARYTELAGRFAGDRFLLVPVLAARARCLALTGDADGADAALAEAGTAVEQLRLEAGGVLVDQAAGLVDSLAGRSVAAEKRFRSAADALDRSGDGAGAFAMRIRAVRERGRTATAGTEIVTMLDRRGEMDVHGQILCLSTAARLGVGDPVGGVGDLLALLDGTDDPYLRGEAFFDLARAHRRRGEDVAAGAMADEAADSYAGVGATGPLRTVRAWR